MAQLRQDYEKFVTRDTEILVIAPDDVKKAQRYWEKHDLPFIGLPDPDHTVASLYGQEVRLLRLGRMPALFVVDRAGQIRYRHYGRSMRDIPSNAEILALLDRLNESTYLLPTRSPE
jgi:peroxiredoxin Q/BCP